MSARAIANLRRIWENYTVGKVYRTSARDPQDIASIQLGYGDEKWPNGRTKFTQVVATDYRSMKDVPEGDRWRAQIAWRHFYGFTGSQANATFFQMKGHRELDLQFKLTLDFLPDSMSEYGVKRPADGQRICGTTLQTEQGLRYERWFVINSALRKLMDMVREGYTELSVEELGRAFLIAENYDTLWIIARLLFHDDVAGIVEDDFFQRLRAKNQHLVGWQEPEWAKHPAAGLKYGQYQVMVPYAGMRLPFTHDQIVHTLSYRLDEPKWWTAYQQLAISRGMDVRHDQLHCPACFETNPSAF